MDKDNHRYWIYFNLLFKSLIAIFRGFITALLIAISLSVEMG